MEAAFGRSMVREYYGKICAGDEVRANLIALRDALKEEKEKRSFAYLLGGDFGELIRLLRDEDPKIRRNAALILGNMESEDMLPVLFDAYKNEKTLFIRSDYLKAMAQMDYQSLTGELAKQLEQLRSRKLQPEEEKHVNAEIRQLQGMVMKYQKIRRHSFTGYAEMPDVILVTNRCQREVTARQLKGGQITLLAGGIRVKNVPLEEILRVRTWSEMLFPLKKGPFAMEKPERMGEELAEEVLAAVYEMHSGKDPYRFRIEWKSKMPQQKRGHVIRKVSDGLERASGGRLLNSVTDYEIELRLLERRDGTCIPMLKLYTIYDRRFAYRTGSVAASVQPVNAALTAELARPYLQEGAQILDPFCGVGTMLLERNFAVHAGNMYGIDIFGEAIEKAKENTAHIGCHVNYINKDYFAFEHGYLFDEIITDMPRSAGGSAGGQLKELYIAFFDKSREHLKKGAVLVLYSSEPRYVADAVRRYPEYRIIKKYIINEKDNTSVIILRWGGTEVMNKLEK